MNSEINGQRYYRSTIRGTRFLSFPFLSVPFRFIARRKKGCKIFSSASPRPRPERSRRKSWERIGVAVGGREGAREKQEEARRTESLGRVRRVSGCK